MAEALIAKHNISLSEIETEANPRNKIVVVQYTPFSTTAMWEQIIAHAVGDLCGCGTYFLHAPGSEEYTTFEFAGLVPNTEACLYILKEVNRQRKDAWFKYRAGGGPDSFGKFCFGFARGLESKIRRLVTKSQIDERELAKLWFAQRNTVHTADPITGELLRRGPRRWRDSVAASRDVRRSAAALTHPLGRRTSNIEPNDPYLRLMFYLPRHLREGVVSCAPTADLEDIRVMVIRGKGKDHHVLYRAARRVSHQGSTR